MRRLLPLLVALLPLLLPASSVADGDPGSDVLIYQNLFYGADDNVSPAQELQLGALLGATTTLHAPVRVAVIGRRDDLGTVTPLWDKPAAYARYLGTELELAYSGRLVVVMPSGVAFFWFHHGSGALAGIRTGRSSDQLVTAADAAVTRLEASAGISGSELEDATHARSVKRAAAGGAAPSPRPSGDARVTAHGPSAEARGGDAVSGPVIIGIGLVIVLSVRFWAPPLWRRRRLMEGCGIAARGLAIAALAITALVGLAVAVHEDGPSTAGANPLDTNPYIDPGSSLIPAKAAPNFTLTDETGQRVSLSQYRGKVVILAFIDDECQTICPLTTQAMVDARDSLGNAAREVQLLAVNANWRSTQVDDVLSYTQLHGLVGQWHFLTGSRRQLQHVWNAYGVGDDVSSTSNVIAHTPALEIIDPEGRLRKVYTTQSSYGAIAQFGQVLAREASALLPSHPEVQTHYSYNQIKGISPSTAATLRKVGGGNVTLGRGKPHLYLFFATWDQQSTPIKSEMTLLNAYARAAKRLGLPPITAIDEGSVEPNRTAVSKFLSGVRLDYPVAIDSSGQVADGYGVKGEPWFVLTDPGAANPAPWNQEVYTEGWPTIGTLEADVRGALKPAGAKLAPSLAARDLAGSPVPLAKLHRQANRLLPGGEHALAARVKALYGYPIVVNIWASWCVPCQKEFEWFGNESAIYGKRVAFLGADFEEASASDGADFLAGHHVNYPSYSVEDGSIGTLLPGGVEGTPTTLFIGPDGKVVKVWIGQEPSEQALAQQIQTYALDS